MPAPATPVSYEGKTVLVTGSSRGIGFELAHGFATAGATVVLNGRDHERTETARQALLARLRDEGIDPASEVLGSTFDIVDPDEVAAAVTALEDRFGALDVLINNAGMQHRAPLLELSLEDWRRVVDTNLTGAFVVSQAVARGMVQRGSGAIVNICSVQTSLVRKTTAPYAASKAGIAGLTRAMCAEWAPLGLRVNGLAPGYLATEMNATLAADPQFTDWITGRTPAGRWGVVDDIVGPALWLCSDQARFVNGQIIYADGGITAVI